MTLFELSECCLVPVLTGDATIW